MENVDWARAWLRLKVEIAKKSSHGKRDLFDVMGDIEVECMTPFDPRDEGVQTADTGAFFGDTPEAPGMPVEATTH